MTTEREIYAIAFAGLLVAAPSAHAQTVQQSYTCLDADRIDRGGNAKDWAQDVLVRLKCVVTPEGQARSCSVESEQPSGLGAGEAALHLACLFKWKRQDGSTTNVDEVVPVPVRFKATQ